VNHWKDLRDADVARRFTLPLTPLTPNQGKYLGLIRAKTIVVGMGPAGTGKSYLPTAYGLEQLQAGRFDKLVLTRPLVTCRADNKDALGILPGEMNEKVAPYLRPLLDVLTERAGASETERLVRTGRVELVPLDVMRGLSFKRALVVADEMQNASAGQLRMLLTRFGAECKVIVSGDPTQSDLTLHTPPLVDAFHRLGGHKDVGRFILRKCDVVRHPLVSWVDGRLGERDGDSALLGRESWYCVGCPLCDSPNWYDDGGAEGAEGVTCWVCRRPFALDEDGGSITSPPHPNDVIKVGRRTAG
jgi:phosphate starvation-inducible PhoH-like protein